MSVTFSIEGNATGAFEAECYDSAMVLKADDYDSILLAITRHKMVCEDCEYGGMYSRAILDVPADLDVNMSNVNAAMVGARLGFDMSDLSGSATGEDFLGRVLLAIAADLDDSGIRATEVTPGARGARMIDCGVAAGYFGERFGQLHALASEAVRLGREVHWA